MRAEKHTKVSTGSEGYGEPHRTLLNKATDEDRRSMLLDGKAWVRGAYVDLAAGLFWSNAPRHDRLWNMEYHSLRWLDVLRRAHRDESDVVEWSTIARSWIDSDTSGKVSQDAWRVLPAIQRCQTLSLGLDLFYTKDAVPSEILFSVRKHLDFLQKHVSQGQVLHLHEAINTCLIASRVLPEGKKRAAEFVDVILEALIDREGLVAAACIREALSMSASWAESIRELGEIVEDADSWLDLLANARSLLLHGTRPDGRIFDGGNGHGLAWDELEKLTPEEAYAASCGGDGNPSSEVEFVAHSGWVFSRSGWGETERDATDETFFSVRFGDTRSKSQHDDNSAVTYQSRGVEWLHDLPRETWSDNAVSFGGRLRHNTVSFSSHKYRPLGKAELIRNRRGDRAREYLIDDTAFSGIQHRRTVAYSESADFCMVIDQVRSADEHRGIQTWILPAADSWIIGEKCISVLNGGSRFFLEILSPILGPLSSEILGDEHGADQYLRVTAEFASLSSRVITVFGAVPANEVPTLRRVPIRGKAVVVEYSTSRHQELLVSTDSGCGVGAYGSDPEATIQRISDVAIHGDRDPADERRLRLRARGAIVKAKEDAFRQFGVADARERAIAALLDFSAKEKVVGLRDYGIGAALIDLAGSDLRELVRDCSLVTQQKRLPVVNWNNDQEMRHAFYDVPVQTTRRIPDAFARDPKRFIHSVDYGQLVLPALINSETPGQTLSIMFHGATDRVRNTLPRFERMRSMESLAEGPIAFFSDPCLDLDSNMILSWYAGTEEINLHEEIAAFIANLARSMGSSNIVLIGNSGGAFTALQVSTYLPEASVIAFNPQIDIDRYQPRISETAHENLFGLVSAERPRELTPRMKVIQRFEQVDFERKVYLIQNTGDDHHMVEHFEPFRDAFLASKHPENLRTATPDLGPGHRVPLPGEYLEEIRRGFDFFFNR